LTFFFAGLPYAFICLISLEILEGDDDIKHMRRYNVHVKVASAGMFELIKENVNPLGVQEEDYWSECFTWTELKNIVPRMKALGWKLAISPVDENDLNEKIHLFPFTYGVNHEVQMFTISGLRLIMTRDSGVLRNPGNIYNPFRY
jgi:hypothetical protein